MPTDEELAAIGHDEPGQNLAILQTLVRPCKLHNVNPYDYLVDILVLLHALPLANR